MRASFWSGSRTISRFLATRDSALSSAVPIMTATFVPFLSSSSHVRALTLSRLTAKVPSTFM